MNATPKLTAARLYRELSAEPSWAAKSRAVRWIAARYYAHVETACEVLDRAHPRPVSGAFEMPPEITEAEAREIIRFR